MDDQLIDLFFFLPPAFIRLKYGTAIPENVKWKGIHSGKEMLTKGLESLEQWEPEGCICSSWV